MFLTQFVTLAVEDLDAGFDAENQDLTPYVEDEDEQSDTLIDEPVTDGGEGGDDELPDADVVIDDIDTEVEGTESLGMEIEHLINLAGAIEQFGISPGLMMVADREGLLAGNFPTILATEAMTGPYRPEAPTSTAALEGVLDAIKSKTAEWAAKAGAAIKSLAMKGVALIKRAIGATAHIGTMVAAKAWNATKAAGRAIKAHPYRTAAAVITAIAAVAAAVAIIWAFPAVPAEVAGWVSKVRVALSKIASPFGKVSLESVGSRLKSVWTPIADAGKAATGTVVKLGYSSKAVLTSGLKGLQGALTKVMGAIVSAPRAALTKFNSGTNWVADKAARAAIIGVARTGGSFQTALAASAGTRKFVRGFAGGTLISAAMALTAILFRHVVVGGYRLVCSTFSRVSSEAESGEAAGA